MPDDPNDILSGGLVPRAPRSIDPSERVRQIASRAKISPDIADDYLKTTKIESGHNVNVRDSSKGAQGFGQVMPDRPGGTIRTVGGRQYNLRDPDQNIEAGLRYFAEGGPDPVSRRLYYFGGPKAKRHYESTGQIPNISDGNMTAAQYVKATGGGLPNRPPQEPSILKGGLTTKEPPQKTDTPDIFSGGLVETTSSPQTSPVISRQVWTRQVKTAPRGKPSAALGLVPGISALRQVANPANRRNALEVGGSVGQASPANQVRQVVRQAAPPLALLPQDVQEWITSATGSAAGQIAETGAGAVRGAIKGNLIPAIGIARALGAPKVSPEPIARPLSQAAQTLQQGSQAMDAEANRGFISREAKNLVAGGVGSSPAMALTALGVPAPVAFGLQSNLAAQGRDAELNDIIKETAKGAAIGALFELPLPAKAEMLTGIQRAAVRAGIVGGGTAALTGSPKESIINAAFAATGGGKESPKLELDANPFVGAGPDTLSRPVQTVPNELQAKVRGGEIESALAQREAAVNPPTQPSQVPAMRVLDQLEGRQTAGGVAQVSEPPPSPKIIRPNAPQLSDQPIESVETGAKLNCWQHRNFGLVTETADQSGVTAGKVRVIDEKGDEHIIQRSNGRGEGNNIAVPVRDSRAADEAARAQENQPFKVIDRRQQPASEPVGAYKEGSTSAVEAIPPQPETKASGEMVGAPTEIREPSQRDINNAVSGTYEGATTSKQETVDVDSLTGGVRLDDPAERRRVDALKAQMQSPGAHFTRVVVDADGNVVEGQHRLEAARELGFKEIPILRVSPVSDAIPNASSVVKELQSQVMMRPEHARQLVDRAAEIVGSEGFDALKDYEAPQGYEKEWNALMKVLDKRAPETKAEPTERIQPSGLPRGQQQPVSGTEPQPLPRAKVSSPSSEVPRAVVATSEGANPDVAGAIRAQERPVAERPAVEPERPRESETTSARKAQLAQDRAELDLPELPQAERKSWQTSLANAKPERATLLADEVLNKPRSLNDEETASLVVRAQQIKNEHAQTMKEIGESSDPDVIAAKKAQADALENEFDRITRATKASGTEKGRTLAAQKLTINKDFDLISVKQRMKAAKGRELTPEESARYENMVKERDQAIVERDKAVEAARTSQIQREIGKVQRQRRRAETREALDTEAATIKSNIAAEFARLKSQQSKVLSQGGLGNLDPEGVITRELVRYARNRVKANLELKAEQLIDDVHELVKGFTDKVSRREIAELISGYKMTAPERKPEDVRRLAEIRNEIKNQLGAEDVAKGIRSPSREGPTKGEARQSGIPLQGPKMSEARKLPAAGPRLSEGVGRTDIGPRPREGWRATEGPRLSEGKGRTEGPRKSEARQLPAEGVPRRLFSRNEARLKQLQKQEAELSRRLEEGDFSPKVKSEPLPYTREVYAKEKQVREIEERFKREEYRATRGVTGKLIDTAAGFGNIPKTMLSMADVSAVLRQGGIGVYQHPILSGRAGIDMLKSFTQHGFANVENAIKSSPRFDQAKRAGVEFTGVDKDNPQLSKHEEGYLGSGAIDMLAKGRVNPLRLVKGVKDFSERTFVSFLDSQRMRIFENQAKALEDMGLKGKDLDAALKSQAKYINIITGRGSLGVKGNQAAPALNVALFSPRLIASRFQFLNKMANPVAWANMPKGARKLQMIDNAKFLFGVASTLALAKAAGANVSLDPDDSEFLKIKVGNTRYDTLAGLQQPMRFMYRMSRAMKGGETYEGADKGKIVGDFARSKAAPLAGYAADYLEGKNRLSGKKFEAGKDLIRNVIPLPFQDFQEAIKEDGTVRGIAEAFPTLFGVGTQTYPTAAEKPTTKAEKLARKFIGQSMPDEGRTQEQIDLDQKKSDLRSQSRRGVDVTANLKALEGLVTDKQAKSILGSRGVTRLQEDVKRLPLYDPTNHRDVLTVYSTMTPSEQESVKKIVGEKAATVDLLPLDRQQEVKGRLIKLGFKPGLNIPRPPQRPERPDRPNQRAWQ